MPLRGMMPLTQYYSRLQFFSAAAVQTLQTNLAEVVVHERDETQRGRHHVSRHASAYSRHIHAIFTPYSRRIHACSFRDAAAVQTDSQ